MARASLAVATPFALLVICAAFTSLGCDNQPKASEQTKAKPTKPPLTSLQKKDVKVGSGPTAAAGDMVSMSYTGKLGEGTVFDTNEAEDGRPFVFTLGKDAVIQGWHQGIPGMKVGGVRELSIPANLAYGKQGMGGEVPIPPDADLYFTVKLLDVVKPGEESVYDTTDVKVGSGRAAKIGDQVEVNYKVSFVNGRVLEELPVKFHIGQKEVIVGLEDGVVGMKVGGVRRLRVPPGAIAGPRGIGAIPGDQTMIFEVTLKAIK